jgi:protein-L-isoaspartate(D-aspartate) O-methyltransferase
MTSLRTRERLVNRLADQGITDLRVLDRFRAIPRHIFIDEALASRAYEDDALPIGSGQTISQPFTIAKKIQELILELPLEKRFTSILEIGSGCGYQLSLLSIFAEKVYGIERIYNLVKKSSTNMRKLKITNVSIIHADGSDGHSNGSPYDAIIISAALKEVPLLIFEQLKKGGVLIAPIGDANQRLIKFKNNIDDVEKEDLGPANFVPFLKGIS